MRLIYAPKFPLLQQASVLSMIWFFLLIHVQVPRGSDSDSNLTTGILPFSAHPAGWLWKFVFPNVFGLAQSCVYFCATVLQFIYEFGIRENSREVWISLNCGFCIISPAETPSQPCAAPTPKANWNIRFRIIGNTDLGCPKPLWEFIPCRGISTHLAAATAEFEADFASSVLKSKAQQGLRFRNLFTQPLLASVSCDFQGWKTNPA